jgi:hypothetical protein
VAQGDATLPPGDLLQLLLPVPGIGVGYLLLADYLVEHEVQQAVGVDGSPWPIVPGLVVAGAGLALLVVPLVNVVLAAIPVEVAGGASGLFSTAQQLGGTAPRTAVADEALTGS